jgi:GNAT superfamily N-acetyltransferase
MGETILVSCGENETQLHLLLFCLFRFFVVAGSLTRCGAEVMHIMVDPQHQRKGIGGHLLKSVTDKADAVNAPTLIVSSVEGHGLYSKHGFESLGTWDIDNEAWAHKIVEHEKSIGYADGVIDLEDKCRGMRESEDSMIRQPIIRS